MKSMLRRVLSANTRARVRQTLTRMDTLWLKLFGSSALRGRSVFANCYYWLFNTQFSREHKAVIAGRVAYKQGSGVRMDSAPMLRRNIHRLEKGLSMQPRRDIFGEAFVVETVIAFNQARSSQDICTDELAWSFDVLQEYFSVVGRSAEIDSAREIFNSDCQNLPQNKQIPYPSNRRVQSGVNYDAFMALCRQRRSVRWYTAQAIEDDKIDLAIEAASQAPSACNRQAYRFYVANSAETAPQISQLAGGTAGFADNIPCVIVVVGDLSAYAEERDRHLIYIDASLASMQLMLALEAQGLSSCPINWPDLEVPEAKMTKRLGLKPWERPVMLISVGYAQDRGLIPFSQKRSASQLRKDIS